MGARVWSAALAFVAATATLHVAGSASAQTPETERFVQLARARVVSSDSPATTHRLTGAPDRRGEASDLARADTLLSDGHASRAATLYAAIRDRSRDPAIRARSAWGAVLGLRQVVHEARRRGALSQRSEPPELVRGASNALPIPARLARLAIANELFLATPAGHTAPGDADRNSIDYFDTRLLDQYGHFELAQQRYERMFARMCDAPAGREAFLRGRTLAIEMGQIDAAERMIATFGTRRCRFGETEPDCSDPSDADDPICAAVGSGPPTLLYRRGQGLFEQAERASGERQERLYLEAARTFERAAVEYAGDPDVPLALEYTAMALERILRPSAAARVHERNGALIRGHRPDGRRSARALNMMLANALFRLGYTRNRALDFDGAIAAYEQLLAEPTLQNANDVSILERREDAAVNVAIILERLGRAREASAAYERVLSIAADDEVRRNVSWRATRTAASLRRPSGRARMLERFASQHDDDVAYADLTAGALLDAADAWDAAGNEMRRREALRRVANRTVTDGNRELVEQAARALQEMDAGPSDPVSPVPSPEAFAPPLVR